MAQQHINLGTPPSGTDGDTTRVAMQKAEANFTELYTNVENAQTTADAAFLRGAKNLLINGNFDFWQRGTSFSGVAYTADRWQCAAVGSTGAYSRQSFAINQTDVSGGPAYFFRTVVTSVAGSGNSVGIVQKVEDVRLLAGQTVTVSFWAKADAARSIGIGCTQDFGGGSPQNALAGQAVALTTVWQKYTVTFAIPAIGSNTFGASAPGWTGFRFYYDAGSSLSSAAGGIGQQSGTFDLAQVQVEVGSVATQFEVRPIALELALCQRYYQKSYSQGTPPGTNTTVGMVDMFFPSAGTGQVNIRVTFPQTMRSAPTVVLYDIVGASGKVYRGANGASGNGSSGSDSGFVITFQPGVSAFEYAAHYTADAEL